MSRCARKNSSVNTLERYTFSNGDTHKDTHWYTCIYESRICYENDEKFPILKPADTKTQQTLLKVRDNTGTLVVNYYLQKFINTPYY